MLSKLTIRPHCAYGSVFTGKLRFARAISRMEVQEGTSCRGFGGVLHAMRLYVVTAERCSETLPGFGVSPKLLSPSPKIEDPPQEEWGTKGVDHR